MIFILQDRKTLLHQSPASSNFEVDRALKEMIIMKAKLSPIVPISGLDINKKKFIFHHPKATVSLIRYFFPISILHFFHIDREKKKPHIDQH